MVGRAMDESILSWQDKHDLGPVRSQIRARVLTAASSIETDGPPDWNAPTPYTQAFREYCIAVEEGTVELPYETEGDRENEGITDFNAVQAKNVIDLVCRLTVQRLEFWKEPLAALPRPNAADEARFNSLAGGWKKASAFTSSATRIAAHPDYQETIEMGAKAIPLILNDLQKGPDHWFIALKEITGENPVPDIARGKLTEMAEAWIKWGEENCYI